MTAEALRKLIADGRTPVIVDARTRREFDAGHVPGAVHIPFWQAGSRSDEVSEARDTPVVVYCGHGPRAYLAGAALKRRGFTNVAYLAGHMHRWRALKFPLERS